MPREFPLVRTYHNLVWNIRHYQPARLRPPFRASRHPFCTNIQLQNASCTYWLKETSTSLGKELVGQLKNSTSIYTGGPSKIASTQISKLHPTAKLSSYTDASAVSSATGEDQNDQNLQAQEVLPAEMEVVRLFSAGEFSKLYLTLKSYKEQGITVSTEIINGMVSTVQDTLPVDTSDEYLHQSAVEVPMFFGKKDLRYTSLYGRMYSDIATLYDVCKLYEPMCSGDKKFVENYMWLCYHMDDLASLQQLLYSYLKRSSYDSRTLSHVINAFVYNYDVEFAKTLMKSIIDMGKPLDESLLSSTIVSFVKVGAIFTNIIDLVKFWSESPNCESPFPKTVALLLKQHYRYGSEAEIASLESLTEELGYNSNFLISMVRNQEKIANRDLSRKKTISKDDIEEILRIRNSISHSKYALKAFYESYLLFFAKYSSMSMMQLILREMKKDGLPLTKYSYNVVVQHYVSENKFSPLLRFMQKFVTRANRFEMIYVKNLFDAFVRTYPYESEHFAEEFSKWIDNANLPEHTKKVLNDACKVTKVSSNITPVAIQRPYFDNHKKYLAPQWTHIPNLSDGHFKKMKTKEQIEFRVDKGIRDVMRKGIKPDYPVIESTFRKLNPSHRSSILRCLKEMRMDKHITRLEIFDLLLSSPKKDQLRKFVTSRENTLNASDRLLLARRLFNDNSYELASQLLKDINGAEMNDNRSMIALNLTLRTSIAKNDFVSCMENIDTFPINDVTLSPYIFKQCQYIEKNLKKKIRALEAKNTDTAGMNMTLQKLKGLIGDIDARLKRDTVDIHDMVTSMFTMLNEWIESTKNQDERKV